MNRRPMFPNSDRRMQEALMRGDPRGMGGRAGAHHDYPEAQTSVCLMREIDPGTRVVSKTVTIPGGPSYEIPHEEMTPEGYAPGLNTTYGNYGVDADNPILDNFERDKDR